MQEHEDAKRTNQAIFSNTNTPIQPKRGSILFQVPVAWVAPEKPLSVAQWRLPSFMQPLNPTPFFFMEYGSQTSFRTLHTVSILLYLESVLKPANSKSSVFY